MFYMKFANMYKNAVIIMLILPFSLIFSNCKKMVQVGPPVTSLANNNVYNSDATAIAVMTAVYSGMSSSNLASGSLTSTSLLSELSGDELSLFPGTQSYLQYYTNTLGSATAGGEFWNTNYPVVYITNSVIEGVTSSSALTPAISQQLLGEAEFMRALCYFYLVNLYGDVPLVVNTNYTINSTMARTPQIKVWQQIIADLRDAQNLLSTNYLDITLLHNTSIDRTRPCKWAATALLARAYLYTDSFPNAEAQATAIIDNSALYNLSGLDTVFLASELGNNEAIWQLQPVIANENTQDGLTFILPPSGPSAQGIPIYLSPFLMNSFESGDGRRNQWIDSVVVGPNTYYYPFKYKVNQPTSTITEYATVLRLAEQYLIRAEARAQQNNILGNNGAIADLNVIRTRAGLAGYSGATDQASVLSAILHERRVELFTEWGHRWFDLKRTGSADSIMGSPGGVCQEKGGNWNSDWQLYPIPLYDLQSDSKLEQNLGY